LSLSKTRGVTAENLATRVGPTSSKKLGSVTLSSGVRRRRVRVGLPRRSRACPYPATCGGALCGSRWHANGDGGPMAAGRARLAPRPPPPPHPPFPSSLPHARSTPAPWPASGQRRRTPLPPAPPSSPGDATSRRVWEASLAGEVLVGRSVGRCGRWGGVRARVLRVAAGVDHGIGIQLTDGLHNKIEG
jgi:hypothetical protein